MRQTRDWGKLWRREAVIDGIRAYFKSRGFHEVETPKLLPTASTEPFLEVFKTELQDDGGQKTTAFLPSSPEFALKKLLAYGAGSVFEIAKSFRNGEGRSSRHNPEFTILEWYEIGGNYWSVAKDFENLLVYLVKRVLKRADGKIEYQGMTYDITAPWERLSVASAFEKYAGIGIEVMLDPVKLVAAAAKKGYQVDVQTSWEEAWNQIIANEIEPKIGRTKPTILYDYPVAQAALAKKAKDPRFAERWEVFLAGMELGNCFSELTDWREQETRCRADLEERRRMGKTEFPMDQEFIAALKLGMPDTGGIAVGVDRLAMLLTNSAEIAEVLTFPAAELFDKVV